MTASLVINSNYLTLIGFFVVEEKQGMGDGEKINLPRPRLWGFYLSFLGDFFGASRGAGPEGTRPLLGDLTQGGGFDLLASGPPINSGRLAAFEAEYAHFRPGRICSSSPKRLETRIRSVAAEQG